jgi:hypothetical protein
MIKPGYRTSEFWLTAVSFLFSGLYLFGLLHDHDQKENLINETSKGVEAAILIIGQLTVLFKYIKGRTEIKKTWWNTASENERKTINKPKPKKRKRTKKAPTSTKGIKK